eukprot:GEMP01008830.1.p1 GENE.GEMP01008830.1~~GEMP01008830.1.p1  ORF type:complete len:572 (+),score=96.33 GEMP01008830.1:173-1888(+)
MGSSFSVESCCIDRKGYEIELTSVFEEVVPKSTIRRRRTDESSNTSFGSPTIPSIAPALKTARKNRVLADHHGPPRKERYINNNHNNNKNSNWLNKAFLAMRRISRNGHRAAKEDHQNNSAASPIEWYWMELLMVAIACRFQLWTVGMVLITVALLHIAYCTKKPRLASLPRFASLPPTKPAPAVLISLLELTCAPVSTATIDARAVICEDDNVNSKNSKPVSATCDSHNNVNNSSKHVATACDADDDTSPRRTETKGSTVSTISAISEHAENDEIVECDSQEGKLEIAMPLDREMPNFRQKLQEFRRKSEDLVAVFPADQDPNGRFDDSVLHRFLEAEGGSVRKAVKNLAIYAKWRKEKFPRSSPWRDWFQEISGEFAGLLMVDFVDKWGRPVIVLRGRFRKKKRPTEVTQKLCVGLIDGTRAVARNLQDRYLDPATGMPMNPLCQYSVIFDLDQFGYSNADLDGLLEVGSMLLHYFPESLTRLWIIHSNFIFKAMWSVCKVFMPARSLKKYVFINSEQEYRQYFPKIIPPHTLPRRYGGFLDDPPTDFLGRYRPAGIPKRAFASDEGLL